MNGVRSTYMRKGYLLTALAAAVLLAASSGTALAQSVGFVGTSATMGEGASPAADTADPITVEIEVSGITISGPGANRTTALGTLTIEHDADLPPYTADSQAARTGTDQRIWVDTTSSALDEARLNLTDLTPAASPHGHLYGVPVTGTDGAFELPYDNNGVIRLVIIDPDGDDNWQDDKFTMRLVTAAESGDPIPPSPSPASFIVTVTDEDPQATVSFSQSSLSLAEGSETTLGHEINVVLTAGNPRTTTDDPMGLGDLTNNVRFRASPATAIVVVEAAAAGGCDPDRDSDVLSIKAGATTNITYDSETKTFTVGADGGVDLGDLLKTAAGVATATASFEVEACGVPHPVSWTHVCATRHGVARIARALRVACDTPAFRGASTGCSVRRTQRRPRAPRRGFERPGRRRLAP